MREIKAGDRIRFNRTLTSPPTGDHPAYIYAQAGDLGTIDRVGGCSEGYWVYWDGWKHAPFGCERKEFELISE
jgi:hypothetical protein